MKLLEHTLPRPDGLLECETLVDVGAGIRPMTWYKPTRHLCMEPYTPYAEVLEAHDFPVLRATAAVGLKLMGPDSIDQVIMLDVIEHMTKLEGLGVLDLAKAAARQQVVIYTPHGFKEQDHDPWGLDGHDWQRHRSGWLPEEFTGEGWTTQLYHPRAHRPVEGFWALWRRPTR